jgi:hypothetical protein
MTATTPATEATAKHTAEAHISYNGMNASFAYNPEHLAEHLRVRALDHYDIRGQARQEEFLFGPDNQSEINDGLSIGVQVTPGSQLYLHRRAQSGGTGR